MVFEISCCHFLLLIALLVSNITSSHAFSSHAFSTPLRSFIHTSSLPLGRSADRDILKQAAVAVNTRTSSSMAAVPAVVAGCISGGIMAGGLHAISGTLMDAL